MEGLMKTVKTFRVVGVPAEIETGNLLNTKKQHYRFGQLAQFQTFLTSAVDGSVW
jgi:hypothetical protein